MIGDSAKLGKATGMDGSKNTFIRLYGVEACKKMVASETERAIGALEAFENADFLRTLALSLVGRES